MLCFTFSFFLYFFIFFYKTGDQIKMQAVVKVTGVFYCLGRTVCASCGAGKRTHTASPCRSLVPCLHAYCISVWACHALCVCVCACARSNYSNPNVGSAGETGCLLINEQSRWSWVGGSCECTSEAGQVVRAPPTPGPSNKQNTLIGSAGVSACGPWRKAESGDCERS